MNRHIKSVLICLLLGAIVNVGVAWGCALSPATPYNSFTSIGDRVLCYMCPFREPSGFTHFIKMTRGEIEIDQRPSVAGTSFVPIVEPDEFDEMLPTWSALLRLDPVVDIDDVAEYQEFATGWPFYSMRLARTFHGHRFTPFRFNPTGRWDMVLHDAIEVPEGLLKDEMRNQIPLRPIWPGFLGNTAIYAAGIWTLFFAPFTLRRTIRHRRRCRRGLCINCAYDLRGTAHARCPECGAATT